MFKKILAWIIIFSFLAAFLSLVPVKIFDVIVVIGVIILISAFFWAFLTIMD